MLNGSRRKLVRIRAVEHLEGFSVRLEFTDGRQKIVNLDAYVHSPIFQPLRDDPVLFRAVTVDHELGTIMWPNGADLDPDVLYYGLTPAEMEEGEPGSELPAQATSVSPADPVT